MKNLLIISASAFGRDICYWAQQSIGFGKDWKIKGFLDSRNDILNKYDTYNNWSKVRQISTITTVGIWLLSFADAIWSDYPRIELGNSKGEINSVAISVNYMF